MNKYTKLMKATVKVTGVPDNFSLSGPQKISLKDNCAFSLPAGPKFACPGATEACQGCYAMKSRHLWSPVQKAFARNWRLMRKLERYDKTNEAVRLISSQIKNNAEVFRIFESGDFHSQWAVDMWARIVRERPDVHFWAYTRSFHLNFTKLTRNKNFALWASTDDYNIAAAKKFVRRFRKSGVKHAYGPWDHDRGLPKNSFICPVTNDKMKTLGACERCKLCVVKKKTSKNVVFLAH